jgi:CAAX protease family protein
MNGEVDYRRLTMYLGIAFGLSWLVGLIVYLTGGIAHSPALLPGTGFTLAIVLISTGYMWAPAIAHILTRLLTHEGRRDTWLRPHFRRGWPYWLGAWFVPVACTLLGAVVYFLVFPAAFDPTLGVLRKSLEAVGQSLPLNPWILVGAQTLSAMLISPLINSLFTFGEEFGWRAYLLPKLMPLGGRRAALLTGVIWGVWHWPVIAMGHNYGLDYPGAPWLGMVMMVWFTVVVGVFLAWATLRSGSVWPAVIGHAALNGIAGLPAFFVQGTPNPLLGPFVTGLVGSVAWAAIALWILLSPGALRPAEVPPQAPPPAPDEGQAAPA